jgi:hypothetical protein
VSETELCGAEHPEFAGVTCEREPHDVGPHQAADDRPDAPPDASHFWLGSPAGE